MGLKLKEEVENIVGEWLSQKQLSICDKDCDRLVAAIMKAVSTKAQQFDVLECIKLLFHEKDKRIALSYGDIGEYVEKHLVRWMK